MRLLAFAASNSNKSINRQLVNYAISLIEGVETEVLDINDFEMPIYSIDREQTFGIPELAQHFYNRIGEADALLISFAEHNASYTAAYKNLFDWTSRINTKVYQGKPMIMLATSPGARGASSVLAAATVSAPHFGGDLKASLSIARFHSNFDMATGKISNPEIQAELEATLASLYNVLNTL